MNPWALLAVAIVAEVAGTTCLKLADGLARPGWLLGVAVGYGVAFTALAAALHAIPVGMSYAIWSGLGTLGAVAVGWYWFGEQVGAPQIAGLSLILAGVFVLHAVR